MKIRVDREMCESNAVCLDWAPEVFTMDESFRLRVLVESPGPELSSKVHDAVKRCPRGALSVVEEG